MSPSVRRAAALTTGALLLVAGGCASQDPRTNPDVELARLLDTYVAIEAETGRAEHADVRHPIVLDRGHLRRDIERLTLLYPGHVPSLMAAALVSYDARQAAKAAHYLDRLRAIQPVHPDAVLLRARIAAEEGNLPLARRLLIEQVEQVPDHAGLHEALAGVLFEEREYGAARRHLGRAARLGAPGWRVDFNRGLIDERRGDLPGALAHYERSLAANPEFAPTRSRLAGLQARAAEEAEGAPDDGATDRALDEALEGSSPRVPEGLEYGRPRPRPTEPPPGGPGEGAVDEGAAGEPDPWRGWNAR